VRAIAAAADVDPALVIRHFGSKEQLFLRAVAVDDFLLGVTSGPLRGMGKRLVTTLLSDTQDPTFNIYRAMMRASDSERVRSELVGVIQRTFVEPLAPRLGGPDPVLRARLIAAQIAGLIDAIAILADPIVVDADRDRLAEVFGAAIQSLIDYRG
jgi:AcrR family transcriptional regulator